MSQKEHKTSDRLYFAKHYLFCDTDFLLGEDSPDKLSNKDDNDKHDAHNDAADHNLKCVTCVNTTQST